MKTTTNPGVLTSTDLAAIKARLAREDAIREASERRNHDHPNDPWTAAFNALDRCACAV